MKVRLQQVSPLAEEMMVEIARVSSSREDKRAEPFRLIRYLAQNKHWSPFEHAIMTVEIETSRAIAAQLLRHRSCTFQEFSQRYQDVTKIGDEIFEPIELRMAGATNRQSSLDVFDPMIQVPSPITTHPHLHGKASDVIADYLDLGKRLYQELIKAGVATECARFVLPLTTKTRMFMTGNVRSWIHFLELRDDDHAQKEVRLIAQEIKKLFVEHFPHIAKALEYPEPEYTKYVPRKTYKRLKKDQKKALRKDSKKLSFDELAEKYNVSTSTVRRICKA